MNPIPIPVILTGALLGATLINNECFISSSLAAYFYFVICSALLIGITAACYLKRTNAVFDRIFLIPLLTFVLLTIYPFIQTIFFTQKDLSVSHFLLLAYALSLFSFSILLATGHISESSIYRLISVAVTIESMICIFQYGGWLESKNKLFAVSGSWVNPNITAMFIAIALPAVLYCCLQSYAPVTKKKLPVKVFYWFTLLVATIALVLLKCRTAYIGAILAATIQCFNRYRWIEQIRLKYSRAKIMIACILLICLATFAAVSLYSFKQDSADGRMFVWKLSLQMIAKKPVAGVGYGRYAHDYNLFQAEYFSHAKAKAGEIRTAAYINMAYNEFLQIAVEMGMIGLLLFLCLLTSLLVRFPSGYSFSITAYASVAAFTVMSVFNFTIQAIPVMFLFVLYAAILITTKDIKSGARNTWILPLVPVVRLILIVVSAYILISQTALARSFTRTEQAKEVRISGDAAWAIELLGPLKTEMRQSNIYWSEYGMALAALHDYRNAVDKFMTALTISSDPDIYLQAGYCYQQLNLNDSAIRAYTMAKNMTPNRMTPVFALMKLYTSLKDSAHAMAMANKIMIMNPKLRSAETDFYKSEAQHLLKNKSGNIN
jgi:O-antigen polymerase